MKSIISNITIQYKMRRFPTDDELRPIRPIETISVKDWIWIEVDETQSQQVDRGVVKGKRIKMRIPKRELELAKKKYSKKRLKILK